MSSEFHLALIKAQRVSVTHPLFSMIPRAQPSSHGAGAEIRANVSSVPTSRTCPSVQCEQTGRPALGGLEISGHPFFLTIDIGTLSLSFRFRCRWRQSCRCPPSLIGSSVAWNVLVYPVFKIKPPPPLSFLHSLTTASSSSILESNLR